MFEDRTKAHADHVGHGHERMTTAAVGMFQTENTLKNHTCRINFNRTISKQFRIS